MSQPAESHDLPRALGVSGAAAIVITNMIGTGIFTVPAFVRQTTGSGWLTLAVWLLGGLIALSGSLCYAELGTRMPQAGGEYHFLTRTYGRLGGFISGWISFLVGFSAVIATAALGASAYLGGAFGGRIPVSWSAAVLILLLAALHTVGLRLGGRVQTFIAVTVVAAILFFIIAGFLSGRGDWAGVTTTTAASGTWWVALIQVSFAYSGWNAAAYLAGELRDPQHTLPRALAGGTLIVIALYLLLNLVFLYAIPASEWQATTTIGQAAAVRLFGEQGARLISFIIAVTMLGSLSAMTVAGPRVYFAMARDGLVPVAFAHISARSGAPVRAIWAQAVVATLLALTGAFETLLIYVGSSLSLIAALTVAGLWLVRQQAITGSAKVFHTPGYPLTPALFVLLEVFIFLQGWRARPGPTSAALLTIAAGAIVYLIASRLGWFTDHSSE
jgi:APA family basic amino acid/polyamine antiporter